MRVRGVLIALAAALSMTAGPCLAQGTIAGHRAPSGSTAAARPVAPTGQTPDPDEGLGQPIQADTPARGAVIHIPNTAPPETTRDNGPLTGVGNPASGLGALVAWVALALALAACGLLVWQKFMSPLPATALPDDFEADLRALVRQEINTRQDSQIAALKAHIARLEARLAELEGGAPPPFPAGVSQAAAPAARRGPAPIPADYFEDNRQEARTRVPQRSQPAGSARPMADPAPVQRPAARPLSQDDAIASLKNEADYSRLLELYRRCLAGERGALADFTEMHQPIGVVEDADGRFVETDDPEPAIWFVEAAGSNSHGVLLPARKVMRDWDRSYRPMSGHKATAVFGASYDILAGERLSVTNPAWARRTGPASFERLTRGELIGR